MKWSNLEMALAETRRFLLIASKCKPAQFGKGVEHGKNCAAMRRSSLDLTKALATLRTESEYKKCA